MLPVQLSIKVKSHIMRDLKIMEKNSKLPIDELVSRAVLMFIATHSDFMGREPNQESK